MKTVRLLPVVVIAAIALLAFKVIGLVTSGGYVLTGPSIVMAASGGGEAPAEEQHGEGDASHGLDPTLADISPTLEDAAPTLEPEGGGHGAPEGEESAEDHGTAPAEEHGEAPAEEHGSSTEIAAIDPCAPVDIEMPEEEAVEGDLQSIPAGCPLPGESTPIEQVGGQLQPITGNGDVSQNALLQRLNERRNELDTYEQELSMRASLVEAAEARLQERTDALAATEARINALVEERRAFEDGQFTGIVSMYENMRPQDAATIFDSLEMNVLLRIARSMNPRKMSPILAKMTPDRAQALTAGLANLEPSIDAAAAEQTADTELPQIVGQ